MSNYNKSGKTNEAVLLGDVVNSVTRERLAERHEKSLQLQQAWDQILPPVLAEHCKVEEFSAGRLTVVVDGPGYMHELRLCKQELLSEMNRKISGGKIKEIKINIG